MDSLTTKVVKHKPTLAPFECEHCGLIWYGWTGTHKYASDTALCTACYLALDNFLNRTSPVFQRGAETDEEEEGIQVEALSWVQDKKQKPLPRKAEKRFHSSVPKWMRNAITSGMVKTNGQEVYIVYSQGDQAIKADLTDNSKLNPFRVR